MNAERAYLAELTSRLRAVLGSELAGIYAGGSYALGGYEPGRSDLDVAAVVRHSLVEGVAERIIEAARHETLPWPARKLELVVYSAAAAQSRSIEPAFELNLNTGANEPLRADLAPRPGEEHWFAIDRSVLAAHGRVLFGPPAGDVFASPSRRELLPVLVEVLRWYLRHEPDGEDGVLNAGRSLRFAREGVWMSKPALRKWAREQTGTRREVLERVVTEFEVAHRQ